MKSVGRVLAWTTVLFLGVAQTRIGGQNLGVGRSPTADEARTWDLTAFTDGRNLPPGQGTATEGARVYAIRCQGCHGVGGAGGTAEALVGGRGTLASARPLKTVTSYWPYATTLFDYMRRAMPFDAPGTLSNDELYALAAYLLAQDDVIGRGALMNARTLPEVRMPNRDGFIADPRPAMAPANR